MRISNKIGITNLADGSIEDLKNMDSVLIGKFNLLQNNLEKLQTRANIYIDTNYDWSQLNQGYIYFNVLDKNENNILNPLNQIIALNIYKTNYIILKIESVNNNNFVYFYLNTPLVVSDKKHGIIEFLVVKPDFITYQGSPSVNDEYNVSYILKDPSNQKHIENLPLLNQKDVGAPVNGAVFKPVEKKPYKYKRNPFIKQLMKEDEKININNIIFISLIVILAFLIIYK